MSNYNEIIERLARGFCFSFRKAFMLSHVDSAKAQEPIEPGMANELYRGSTLNAFTLNGFTSNVLSGKPEKVVISISFAL
jgi:hypothetical protein